MESLAKLKPVFMEDGSTTAGNASGVGDGAALCILTTRTRAEKEGWEVLGKYVASAFVGTWSHLTSVAKTPATEQSIVQVWSPGTWEYHLLLPSRRSSP